MAAFSMMPGYRYAAVCARIVTPCVAMLGEADAFTLPPPLRHALYAPPAPPAIFAADILKIFMPLTVFVATMSRHFELFDYFSLCLIYRSICHAIRASDMPIFASADYAAAPRLLLDAARHMPRRRADAADTCHTPCFDAAG